MRLRHLRNLRYSARCYDVITKIMNHIKHNDVILLTVVIISNNERAGLEEYEIINETTDFI